jgi:predicted proteasome-type protease
LLSSGNLAGTQAVISLLNQRCAAGPGCAHVYRFGITHRTGLRTH